MKRMKRVLGWLCLALVLSLTLAPLAIAAEGYEKVLDSVVRIFSECTLLRYHDDRVVGSYTGAKTGSGFAIGKKGENPTTFVTNRHVVDWETSDWLDVIWQLKDFPGPHTDENGNFYTTQYVLADIYNYVVLDDVDTKKVVARTIVSDKYDLACVVLANPVTERKPATIGLYDSLGRQDVWALGFPGLSDFVTTGSDSWKSLPSTPAYCKVTEGMTQVMAENDTYGSIVQHSAEISHGNSGGPLVDKNGMVVGVNTWGISENAVQANVSQTTKQLKQFLDSENITAEYAQIGSLPIATIAIIATAVLLIVAIILFGVLSDKKRKQDRVRVVDPHGTRNLVVSSGALKAGSSYSLVPGKTFLIGTDSTQCNLVYPKGTPGVSRVHCSVIFDGKTVTVKDENSTYGLYIDQQRLEKNKPTVLHRGHKLSLGSQKETLVLR